MVVSDRFINIREVSRLGHNKDKRRYDYQGINKAM